MCVCVLAHACVFLPTFGSASPAFQSPSAADFPLNVIETLSAMNNTFTFQLGQWHYMITFLLLEYFKTGKRQRSFRKTGLCVCVVGLGGGRTEKIAGRDTRNREDQQPNGEGTTASAVSNDLRRLQNRSRWEVREGYHVHVCVCESVRVSEGWMWRG